MSLEKEGWFQAAPISLDTSPLLRHPQRGHDGMLGTMSSSLPHPAAAMAGGDCRPRDCRGSPGAGWIGGRVGAAGLQSLSPIGFPWLPSSLRGQVSGPSSPRPEICCQCPLPPTVCVRPAPCTSPCPVLHCLVLGSWCVGGRARKEKGEGGHPCAGGPPGHPCLPTLHVLGATHMLWHR